MSLADWMNDIDGGYSERERMANWGGHEDNCDCPECEQERYDQETKADLNSLYENYPNTQEEE